MDLVDIIRSWPEDAPRGSVTRFCRREQISRSWFYQVRQRVAASADPTDWLPHSTRPHVSPNATAVEVEETAVLIRKQLAEDGWDCGPLSVAARMRRLGLAPPSRATLARIFARRGLAGPEPQKRPRSCMRRFTFALANECWQIDAYEWQLLDGTDVAIYQLIDDHSRRLLASHVATSENLEATWAVIVKAKARVGLPQLLLTDNGVAMNPWRRARIATIADRLRGLGVNPITSTPGHPQTLGKDERVHQTQQKWLRVPGRQAASIDELQRLVDIFDHGYNTGREHQALDGLTPMEAWDQAAKAPPPVGPLPPRLSGERGYLPLRITRPTVNRGGTIRPRKNVEIHIGCTRTGQQLLVLQDGNEFLVFDRHGTHLRTVTLRPGISYYGSYRGAGRPL